MADVKVKLSVDTREAEARLCELELRAGRLNVRTGTSPVGRVGGRVPGIVTIERPGTTTIIDIPEPKRVVESAPSNAVLSAAVGAAAATTVAGELRGVSPPKLAAPRTTSIIEGAAQLASDRPYRDASSAELWREHMILQQSRLGGGGAIARAQRAYTRALRPGLPLGLQLTYAQELESARWVNEFTKPGQRQTLENIALLQQERALRRQIVVTKPNALVGLYRKVDNLPSLISLRERVGQVAGPMATLTTVTAGAVVGGSIFKGLANTADRLSDNIRTGTDYQGSVARIAFEEIWKAAAEKTLKPALEAERKIITTAGKAEAALWYAFGAKARAAAILQVTEQYSGELLERNNALIALQDQWSRGFDQAGQAGLLAARQQSSSAGHRAIQLGLRGGSLLEIDRSIYDEIADKTQRKYQQEYVEKVTYPKMSDVQGDRK